MESCLICRKHQEKPNEIIFRNEYVSVSHYISDRENNQNYLGYYFVDMIRHFDGIQNATEIELNAMMKVTQKLAQALIDRFNGERVYTFILGDGVKHLHQHVIIKHIGAPIEYRACRVDEWPESPRGSYADILLLNNEIKYAAFSDLDYKT